MAPRLPGIGSHHSALRKTDEWLTPRHIIDALGPFDLDPAAPPVQPWPTAARTYTQEDDGLSQDWEGRVWLNAPYSCLEPWMARIAEHGNGIALVFARCETAWWFESVWPHAAGFIFLKGRIAFCRPDGTPATHNSGGPSVLVAYGDANFEALAASGLPGALIHNTARTATALDAPVLSATEAAA